MTIAQPNRQAQLTRVLRLLFLGIAASGIVSVFFYNQMVTQRTVYKETVKAVAQLQQVGADLKNQYYALLDDKHLTDTAGALGYIKESNPRYLSLPAGRQGLDNSVALNR